MPYCSYHSFIYIYTVLINPVSIDYTCIKIILCNTYTIFCYSLCLLNQILLLVLLLFFCHLQRKLYNVLSCITSQCCFLFPQNKYEVFLLERIGFSHTNFSLYFKLMSISMLLKTIYLFYHILKLSSSSLISQSTDLVDDYFIQSSELSYTIFFRSQQFPAPKSSVTCLMNYLLCNSYFFQYNNIRNIPALINQIWRTNLTNLQVLNILYYRRQSSYRSNHKTI